MDDIVERLRRIKPLKWFGRIPYQTSINRERQEAADIIEELRESALTSRSAETLKDGSSNG